MRRISALVFAAALLACATKHTSATGKLHLGKTPEENYQKGVDELKARNYPEAIRFFEYVKAKFPFSPVSVEADLRLADVKYAQKSWSEAAVAYEAFINEHPTSPEVEYAQYRAGAAHFKAAPPDFALIPPALEKDQTETEKAVVLLRGLVKAHPTSKWIPDAKKELAAAETLLAKREMYVGDFYYKREYWAGAAARYRGLTEEYPATPLVEPALLKLAQAYAKQHESFQARQALQRLITQYPSGRYRASAERLLDSLR
jgi:outer membrane protein assembly factor BamD